MPQVNMQTLIESAERNKQINQIRQGILSMLRTVVEDLSFEEKVELVGHINDEISKEIEYMT